MKKKFFIAGIGGCVGHYLFDFLSQNPDNELHLLVRNPQKIKFNYKNLPNIHIIQDDLKNISQHAAIVKQADYIILLAADWSCHVGNYDYTLELLNMLDPAQCKKVIYFSTASIIGSDNQPIKEADLYGTPYIQSKYQLIKELPNLPIQPNIITLFPTWVIGGDANHPYSHAAEGLINIKKWLWLLRFFTVDVTFHYIHAYDIAQITKYLLENETKEKNFVLGNQATSAGQFISEVCKFNKLKIFFRISITQSLINLLLFITRKKLIPWDKFCLKKRHFIHQTVNAKSFGLTSQLETIPQILRDLSRDA